MVLVFSEYFLTTNGVKQGGVLSPVLFCVYLNELLLVLSFKARLFTSYFTSLFTGVFYGICPAVPLIFILHGGRAFKRIWNLPWQAHGYLLPLLSACLPVHDELCLRVLNFVRSCFAHHNTLLHDMVALALRSDVICYAAHSDIHAL